MDGLDDVLCLAAFLCFEGLKSIRHWSGRSPKALTGSVSVPKGYWILAPATVVLSPWQAPETWGELRAALQLQGISLDQILKQIATKIRDAGHAILFVGFPIPLKQAEPLQEIFWNGILMPNLVSSGKPPNGFRSNDLGWWTRDRRDFFSDSNPLEYVRVENWDKTRLCSRGKLPDMLSQAYCAIVGLGSLGSQVAMSMARMGAEQMVLIDGDSISAGNITRHIATLHDVGKKKADLVSAKMMAVSPHIKTSAYAQRLDSENAIPFLGDAEIVIDCTGDYEVTRVLESMWFPLPKVWVCACVGYGATHIYVYIAKGHSFPAKDYFQAISPWLERDGRADPDVVEGAGCWHPVFPARQDDMLLAAAICTKLISETTGASIPLGLQVFEQSQVDGHYGIARANSHMGEEV